MLGSTVQLLARLAARPAAPHGGWARLQLRLKHGAGALRSHRIVHSPQQLAPSSVVVRAAADAEAPAAHEFGGLGLSRELLAALAEKGIWEPTEIQVGRALASDAAAAVW